MPTAQITAVGTYVPPGVLTNADLEKMVDTSDQWIIERTGISERHIASPEMATSDMALEAARRVLEQRGISAEEIELIILCTVTPDMLFPSTACLVQDRLGAKRAWGFDLVAACSGFIYGITTAAHYVQAGTHKKVLVIGSDTMSRIINYKDRSTCVLFGDGAGAFLIEPGPEGEGGFIGFHNEIDGSGGDFLKMPAGGSRMPASHETIDGAMHYVHQEGQQVFKYAVRKMEDCCRTVLAQHDITIDQVKILIPHQANRRIIGAACEKLGLAEDRVLINIQKYGNTTGATIPLATADALAQGKIQKGDYVLFAAVGAGLTAGANLWRWAF